MLNDVPDLETKLFTNARALDKNSLELKERARYIQELGAAKPGSAHDEDTEQPLLQNIAALIRNISRPIDYYELRNGSGILNHESPLDKNQKNALVAALNRVQESLLSFTNEVAYIFRLDFSKKHNQASAS